MVDQYKRVIVTPDGVENSGYIAPSEQDKQHLAMSKGPSTVDMDRLMAMPHRDTHLFRAHNMVMRQLHGESWNFRPQFQDYGTCVGQSIKRATDILMAMNAILYQLVYPGNSAVAGMYTFSRVEIGGQPGRWEGSNGYQAAAALIKYGVLLLKDIGLPEDSLAEDEALAMKWTASRAGVPDNYEAMAQNILVSDVVTPTSVMMAAKLIQAGSPQSVGTTYIPTGTRNSEGVSPCRRSRGGHEMCVDGVVFKNGQPYLFHEQNSWGKWGTGPLPGDTPEGSVWISARDYEIQMADDDISSIIGTNGLKYDT